MNAIIFNDALEQSLTGGVCRKDLVNASNEALSVTRQCELVNLPRSTFYAPTKQPAQFSDEEEKAMKIIDEAHTFNSHYGTRSHSANLARHGIYMGRHKVARLMAHMGIRSTAPQPKTSAPAKKHPKHPYLLRGLAIRHPNQVWATDITYISLGRTHVYLSAVIDLYSRFIVGWHLHDTCTAHEAVICMASAFRQYGTPAICNSDQGATYTASEYVNCLSDNNVRQSMDGCRRWADNVYMERWFRNLKHEQVYMCEYHTFAQLKEVIAQYVQRYNFDRLHSSLDYDTPAQWYFSGLNAINAPEFTKPENAA